MGLTVVASGHAAENRVGYRRAYRWMLPIELVLGVLVGQKSEFLIVVVMFALALRAAGRLPTRRLDPRRCGLAVADLPARGELSRHPAAGVRPSALGRGGACGSRICSRPDRRRFRRGAGEYAQYAFDRTVGRFREADRAAVSIQAHDAGKPYSPPSEMAQRVATGVVPRVLWPDKPLDLYALEVSRDYYGLPPSVITATSLSPVGDAYRYGGLLSVALVMALLGGYVRLLDQAFPPSTRSGWSHCSSPRSRCSGRVTSPGSWSAPSGTSSSPASSTASCS